jgi:hypothetical protein
MMKPAEMTGAVKAAKEKGVTPATIWTGKASGHLFQVWCVAEQADRPDQDAIVVYRPHPMHEMETGLKALPLAEFLTLFEKR